MHPFPSVVAFRHVAARQGFEVAFLSPSRRSAHGTTTAIEAGECWAVTWDFAFEPLRARIAGRSTRGLIERTLQHDGDGHWRVDGALAPRFDGCLDLDLESSALTNAFAVRRMSLQVGEEREAPAVYVRAHDLSVERLEQRYRRLPDSGNTTRYAYAAPAFDVACELTFDEHGLVLEYPGLAVRER